MYHQALANALANWHARVKGGEGVLEDDLCIFTYFLHESIRVEGRGHSWMEHDNQESKEYPVKKHDCESSKPGKRTCGCGEQASERCGKSKHTSGDQVDDAHVLGRP